MTQTQNLAALRGIPKDKTLIIRVDQFSLLKLKKMASPRGTDATTLAKRWILERLSNFT